MGITTSKWDTSECLDSPKMIREYLIAAIGDVAKSQGMTQIAQKNKSKPSKPI